MKNQILHICQVVICIGLMAHFSSAIAIESLAADASSPSEQAERRPQSASGNNDDKPSVICKREKVIGSNMRKRVCYSVKEIKERRVSDREDIRERQIQTPRPNFND